MSAICQPECQNGGICVRRITEYVCNCPSSFYGDACQSNVSMTITFVLIGIAILLGIAACLIIGLCQRFRQEQDRPLIINRIISVRPLRRTTKIDKSKNDVPPAYDDVIVSGNGEAETEVDGAERHKEETECHIGLDIEALPACGEHVSRDESEVNLSTREDHHDAKTVSPEQMGSASIANTNEAPPPPGYKEVENNRASQRVYLHQPRDTSESTDTCTVDDS